MSTKGKKIIRIFGGETAPPVFRRDFLAAPWQQNDGSNKRHRFKLLFILHSYTVRSSSFDLESSRPNSRTACATRHHCNTRSWVPSINHRCAGSLSRQLVPQVLVPNNLFPRSLFQATCSPDPCSRQLVPHVVVPGNLFPPSIDKSARTFV